MPHLLTTKLPTQMANQSADQSSSRVTYNLMCYFSQAVLNPVI